MKKQTNKQTYRLQSTDLKYLALQFHFSSFKDTKCPHKDVGSAIFTATFNMLISVRLPYFFE